MNCGSAFLRESRVSTTRTLADAIGASATPPAFLAGNAMGWYGDHGDTLVTEETDTRGDSLLSQVCRVWQEAAIAAEGKTRIAFLRAVNLGRRRVAMPRLVAVCEGLGYEDAWTWINSGNVVFDATGSRASVDCFPEALVLLASGKIHYPKIASRFPLSEAPAVFGKLADNPMAFHKAVFIPEAS